MEYKVCFFGARSNLYRLLCQPVSSCSSQYEISIDFVTTFVIKYVCILNHLQGSASASWFMCMIYTVG